MLGRRDLLAEAGLAQARRLQNVVALHRRTTEFGSISSKTHTPYSPLLLSRCYVPLEPWRSNIILYCVKKS